MLISRNVGVKFVKYEIEEEEEEKNLWIYLPSIAYEHKTSSLEHKAVNNYCGEHKRDPQEPMGGEREAIA